MTDTPQDTPNNISDSINSKTTKRTQYLANIEEKQALKDEAILNIAKQYPNITTHELGKKLVDVGIMQLPNTIYKRLKQRDYLKERLNDLDHYWKELKSRELMPLATKELKAGLKDKDLAFKDKMPAIKLVYDKQFGEDRTPARQDTHISIDQVQVLIQQGFDKV